MPASSDPIIQFDHATFGFPGVIALKDLSLAIRAGEFIGVIGPNGSGKTTLCKAVLGLMAPVEGHLRIFDCACDELRCHHRAKIGYLPQKGVVDRHIETSRRLVEQQHLWPLRQGTGNKDPLLLASGQMA